MADAATPRPTPASVAAGRWVHPDYGRIVLVRVHGEDLVVAFADGDVAIADVRAGGGSPGAETIIGDSGDNLLDGLGGNDAWRLSGWRRASTAPWWPSARACLRRGWRRSRRGSRSPTSWTPSGASSRSWGAGGAPWQGSTGRSRPPAAPGAGRRAPADARRRRE